jgi:hypothetical protein
VRPAASRTAARASATSSTPSPTGSARGDLRDPPTTTLMALVDEVWEQMDVPHPVVPGQRAREVAAALPRFVAWHDRPAPAPVATEPSPAPR